MSKQGRNRVYQALEKLELIRPDGKLDGFLDKDDAVYVLKRVRIDDKSYYQFRVIKFFQTEKEATTYTSEIKYFKKMFKKGDNKDEKKSSVAGGTDTESKTDIKNKYAIPSITTIGGATLGYFIGNKFGSATKWTIGGLIIGLGVGLFILKKNEKK